MPRVIILCFFFSILCAFTLSQFPQVQPDKDEKIELKLQADNSKEKDDSGIPKININDQKGNIDNKGKQSPIDNIEKTDNKKDKSDATAAKTVTDSSNVSNSVNTEIESGAVLRGVYVFVGLTLLFIMYIAFNTYRKKGKKNVLINKYGVRTRRSDLEMEPLPLDEDDEDETVFELGGANNR